MTIKRSYSSCVRFSMMLSSSQTTLVSLFIDEAFFQILPCQILCLNSNSYKRSGSLPQVFRTRMSWFSALLLWFLIRIEQYIRMKRNQNVVYLYMYVCAIKKNKLPLSIHKIPHMSRIKMKLRKITNRRLLTQPSLAHER